MAIDERDRIQPCGCSIHAGRDAAIDDSAPAMRGGGIVAGHPGHPEHGHEVIGGEVLRQRARVWAFSTSSFPSAVDRSQALMRARRPGIAGAWRRS